MNAIAKYLEAAKLWRTDNVSNEQLAIAASNAAKEIEELVDLLRKWAHPFDNTSIKDTPIIIPTKDADRIREIVGGGE